MVLRPQAAAALAATLCSLGPAAGQQLLAEVEGMLRVRQTCMQARHLCGELCILVGTLVCVCVRLPDS